MIRMTKDEFLLVLERQHESGLSIKDFCLNEAYTDSIFYYWKIRFGLTGGKSLRDLASVNILKSQCGVLTSTLS
ncbi:MAG: IS66 family insertion sequence element accessory protein TnpA [Marinifilaceae bacterium]